jgi:hypothetical protein
MRSGTSEPSPIGVELTVVTDLRGERSAGSFVGEPHSGSVMSSTRSWRRCMICRLTSIAGPFAQKCCWRGFEVGFSQNPPSRARRRYRWGVPHRCYRRGSRTPDRTQTRQGRPAQRPSRRAALVEGRRATGRRPAYLPPAGVPNRCCGLSRLPWFTTSDAPRFGTLVGRA